MSASRLLAGSSKLQGTGADVFRHVQSTFRKALLDVIGSGDAAQVLNKQNIARLGRHDVSLAGAATSVCTPGGA